MGNDKEQTVKRNDETVTFAQHKPQEYHTPTGRININDINKRNAEQEKQEKKSSYILVGIIAFLVVFIVVALYFLS